MVALKIVEDRPTPKEVYGWRVYACALLACWASVAIGYDSAFIGTSIGYTSFKNAFGLTGKSTVELANYSANIVSVYQGGAFFGALFGYPIGFYLGRKLGLLLAGIVFCLSAGIQLIPSLSAMYAGRILLGWAVGVGSTLTPAYIAEIAPAGIRGRLIACFELGWQIGAVVGFWINYGVTKHIPGVHDIQWRIPFGVQLIPGGMLALGTLYLRESPRWLASKDRNEEASQKLAWLRNLPEDHEYIRWEMEDILMNLERDRAVAGSGFWGPPKTFFRSSHLLRRLAIAIGLFACQNGTGINAINYYSPTIFKSIGVTGTSASLLSTGVFGIVKFFGALIWLLFLVDRYGRRKLLLWGASGGSVCMLWIGIYIAVAKPTLHVTTKLSGGGISAMVAIYLWTCFYSPTWNGTPWVFGAEVFPQAVRPITQALVAASNWLFAFAVARGTPLAFLHMGVGGWGFFIMFGAMMLVSIVFVYFIVPETRLVPLERMDELFVPGLPARRAHGVVMSKTRDEVVHSGDIVPMGDTNIGSFHEGEKWNEEVYRESV